MGGLLVLTLALAAPLGAAALPDVRAPAPRPGEPAVAADGGLEWIVNVRSLDGIEPGGKLHGASVLWVYEGPDGALRFAVVSVKDERGFLQAAQRDDNVRSADYNRVVVGFLVPDDPCYNGNGCSFSQYGPQLIGAETAWDKTLGTTAAKLAVTDTGLNFDHVEFADGRILDKKNCSSGNSAKDGNGHGTHVTGVAAADTNNGKGIAGLAQAGLLIARVLNNAGSGSDATVACGVDWARTSGAHIISMSLGCSATCSLPNTKKAIQDAWNGGSGAIVVVASGNDGCIGNSCVGFPANMPEATAVGCVDSAKKVCSFSNGGPELDLVAPGLGIWSTWKACQGTPNCYAKLSGTSMSTPHVSGVAALIKTLNSGFTGSDLRTRLINNAEDLGAQGFDNTYGNGMVRADLAVS